MPDAEKIYGRSCVSLSGEVSLENNGGFVQASLALGIQTPVDASAFDGVLLDVYGKNELRTSDVWFPWSSYRATLHAAALWQTQLLPFAQFEPYRIDRALDVCKLQRMALAAIGRQFMADVCVARVALYRNADL